MSAPLEVPLPRRAPQAHGITPESLRALAERLSAEGLDPHTLLVARGGEVVFEAEWAPYRLARPALVYSASKTFTSLAIGLLAEEGRLDLHGFAADLLNEPVPHAITVHHLLTMNTGHDAAQIDALGDDPRELFRTPPRWAPGTHFSYNNSATHALSAIVTALTGEPLMSYLGPRLWEPLGIGPRWMRRIGGIEYGASGLHATAEDLARVAIMLAGRGVFRGTRVVPEWYVEQLQQPWSDTAAFEGPDVAAGEVNDWALGYGYQVWRSRHGYRLDGAAGQFGLVLPEQDLVIAYQGATSDTAAVLRAFWDFVESVGAPTEAGEGILRLAFDSWDQRGKWTTSPGAPLGEVSLADADDGWILTLPGVGELPVGQSWHESVCAAAGSEPRAAGELALSQRRPSELILATRGESGADGRSALVHVVSVTSPHRVLIRRDAQGKVTAGWHVAPLGGGWKALRVPPGLTRVRTRAAALLLDMDGTLVDSHEVVERLWSQWSRDHGIDPARTLSLIHGRQGQESMALLLPDRPHEENLADNREMLARETVQTEGVVAIPGAAALLSALAGRPHALVTSASAPLARARMDAAGLPMPPLSVTAEDVARSKPDPEGFVAAARALGVAPEECIVLEDSPNGIAAGLAAGMRVIGIGSHALGATWRVADARAIVIEPGSEQIVLTIGT